MFTERVPRIPFLVRSVAILKYPERFRLIDLLRDGFVHETDFLSSEIVNRVTGNEREGLGGSITAECYVDHVFVGAGKCDYIYDVEPGVLLVLKGLSLGLRLCCKRGVFKVSEGLSSYQPI